MLHGATGGSPLFLREIVRELPADGLLLTVPVSPTVRDHVASRFERLPEADGAMLDAAAVLGAEFDARACAQVLDRPLPEVLDALDRAAALGIVVPVPGAPGRFAFTHAVLREVRYEAIPAGRRMRLHHAAGTVLRAAGAPVTDLARHFYEAADLGDREDAFTYARRAGELARERFAFADAAVHFEQAARLAGQLPGLTDRDRCELAIEHGEALHRAGDPGHRAVLLDAAATARRLDDPDLLTRAALALSEQGWTISSAGSDGDRPGGARRARAAAGRRRGEPRAADGDDRGRDPLWPTTQRRRELGAEALAAARASGDGNVLGEVLISAHWACFDPLNLDAAPGLGAGGLRPGRAPAQPGRPRAGAADAGAGPSRGRRPGGGPRRPRPRGPDRRRARHPLPARLRRRRAAATLAALAGRLDDAERLAADCSALARRIGASPPFFVGAGVAVAHRAGTVGARCRDR